MKSMDDLQGRDRSRIEPKLLLNLQRRRFKLVTALEAIRNGQADRERILEAISALKRLGASNAMLDQRFGTSTTKDTDV